MAWSPRRPGGMQAADQSIGSRGRVRTLNLPDLALASRRRCLCPSTQVTGMAGRGEMCLDVRGRAPVATRVASRRCLRRRLGSSRTTPRTGAACRFCDPWSPRCIGAFQRREQAFDDGVQILTTGPVMHPQHDQSALLALREPNRVGEVEGSVTRARRAAAAASTTARSDCPDNPRPPRCRHRGRPPADEQMLGGPGSRPASASRDVDEPSAGQPGPVRQTRSNVRTWQGRRPPAPAVRPEQRSSTSRRREGNDKRGY